MVTKLWSRRSFCTDLEIDDLSAEPGQRPGSDESNPDDDGGTLKRE